MAKNRTEYTELSRARVTDSRNIVLSKCSKGGYTIAQQLEANENGKVTSVFMKGAFHVEDLQGLYNLRDAVNLAIKISEEGFEEDQTEWDAE